MRRSFQWELMLFTSLVSGGVLCVFLLASGWLMLRQFEQSVDGKMHIPGERLVAMLHPEADMLELVVEYSELSANHPFELVVWGNDGSHWYTSPGAEWLEGLGGDGFIPAADVLAAVPAPRRGDRRGRGPLGPPGPPWRSGPPESGPRPIWPMTFRGLEDAGGAAWRVGSVSNFHVTVVIAMKLADFDRELTRVRYGFAVAVPLALLAVMGSGWLVSQRALRPLRRIIGTARELDVAKLGMRVESTGAEPAEFADLIGVLNEMMERLERGFGQARRFTADASHELKTPIALIQSGIEEALVDCRAANGDPAVLMSIAKEVRRLKGILEGLLLLSRADAGELRLVNETVDLSRELGLFCEDVEVLADSREIKTELSIAPGVHVCGDRILLGQAIQNLLSNAIKYNCEGGTLWCSLSVENEFVVLEIANTGSVIPQEDVPLVFQRFYRVDKARSRAVDGIGLGLNIAWEIVKAHQGSLTLERSDERATVFRAVLPLVPQAIEG